MSLATATAWEVRTSGVDTNGGGYVSGGTDYSQQDAPALSLTDLAAAQNSTTAASAAAGFTAAMVGNLIQIASGTNFVAGFYQIVTFNSATSVVLDRAPATAGAGSAGVAKVGGALATPGKALSAAVAGNTVYIKAGTYPVTSTSTNVAGGCLAPPAGTSTAATVLTGYQTTRGDGGTKPILQASGIATFTMLTLAVAVLVENLEFDGASLTSARGVAGNLAGACYSCRFRNFTNSAASCGSAAMFYNCEATGCATATAFTGAHYLFCTAHDNTVAGFNASTGCILVRCLSASNSGATSDGFTMSANGAECVNCTAYNNGRDGFRFLPGAAHNDFINCLAVGNAGWGFNASATGDACRLFACAHATNAGGGVNTSLITRTTGTVALSSDPLMAAATGNYGLNNLGGAGLPARSQAYTFPGVAGTIGYGDLGAAQHFDQPSGGSGSLAAFRGL